MAELPPKIPTITQNWPSSPHQRMSTVPNFMAAAAAAATTTITAAVDPTAGATTTSHQNQEQQSSSWVDEFLDFSAARRGTHRRSASDSIAFLETSFLEDDHLFSMFSDDISTTVDLLPSLPSSSNPCSPSDQNSNEDEKAMALDVVTIPMQDHMQPKKEAGEAESSGKNDAPLQLPPPSADPGSTETIVDPKRVKRTLANRQSAQRSRVRKLQYISELERSVTSLQTEVSALSPRVALLDHQRVILNVDNSALKQRIAALAQDKIFKDAHQEALKKEIERLRQIYHQQQNLQKMGNTINNINNNGHNSLHCPPTSQPQPPHSLHQQLFTAFQPIGSMDEQLLS